MQTNINIGFPNQGTRDIELVAKVDGRADAADGNNDASNDNTHGRPMMINKNNRMTNANHKL